MMYRNGHGLTTRRFLTSVIFPSRERDKERRIPLCSFFSPIWNNAISGHILRIFMLVFIEEILYRATDYSCYRYKGYLNSENCVVSFVSKWPATRTLLKSKRREQRNIDIYSMHAASYVDCNWTDRLDISSKLQLQWRRASFRFHFLRSNGNFFLFFFFQSNDSTNRRRWIPAKKIEIDDSTRTSGIACRISDN